MPNSNAPLVHFLFRVKCTMGEFNYSVIALQSYRAEDEVNNYFSQDPNFKIMKQFVSKTYLG
ncbi:hypothetical protein [Acinetobacter seifertii]|uniref:hypothetical protein n=1 Tax=Acinetobacter seifertii TaxID=1530123 RepID=UPI001F053052|nr:hypothetical protein [Acinetobacter seifertii]MCH2003648.1 hypothetical protein [Acinetobacter seifertii]